jgi:hypothetical protein
MDKITSRLTIGEPIRKKQLKGKTSRPQSGIMQSVSLLAQFAHQRTLNLPLHLPTEAAK